MGGDVCDMWVVLTQPNELWHPRRCEQICQEAARAPAETSSLLLTEGFKREHDVVSIAQVEEHFASGSLGHLSENDVRTTCSSIVVRVPSLAKFLASISSDVLRHEFCDLAFCSYAWNDPCGQVTKLDLPWSVCLCCHDLAARLAEFALGSVVDGDGYDASLERKKECPHQAKICRGLGLCHLCCRLRTVHCLLQVGCRSSLFDWHVLSGRRPDVGRVEARPVAKSCAEVAAVPEWMQLD